MGTKTFRELTTFKVGGSIKSYFEVKDDNEIIEAVRFAKKKNLKIFVIGDGTDILVSDDDYEGVVIKYTNSDFSFDGEIVTAKGGLNWDKLVDEAVSRDLQGIECLSGIPGTVGAAPIQNIGAYGQELKDTFVSLRAFSIADEKFVEFDNKDCLFGYRESFFKKPENWQKYIITEVKLKLNKNARPQVSYESLKKYLPHTNYSLNDVRQAILRVRKEKLEDPTENPNAGSFFKNPIVSSEKLEAIKKDFPDVKFFKFGNDFKISAAWLIEKSGFKGKGFGKAKVSDKHSLVITNPNSDASFDDIYKLSRKVMIAVSKKFGIVLEREVQVINHTPTVAILGYGIEGKDLEKYLLKKGIKPVILDEKNDSNYLSKLKDFEIVYRSPGVYRYKPEIVAAGNNGARISSALEVFFESFKGKIIGVTGTKGKGTTSTLIYEILKSAGYDVHLAGNIGKPYLELLSQTNSNSWVVLEMSSFQLFDLKYSPHIAVVLNITQDHMDWHKSKEEYISAKMNIVLHQSEKDFAVINEEYETSKSFAQKTKANIVFFSKEKLEDQYKKDLILRGKHNWENIAAAVTVAKILKVDADDVSNVVHSFKGLEHRLEFVGQLNGVKFYNDSFATGPDATMAAINAFEENETLILGGSDKGLDYKNLGALINSKENVKNIVLIGEIRNEISKHIKGKNIIDLGTSSMDQIVSKAFEISKSGEVVILSPAAASFDMFENYKDRGNQFKRSVKHLE